MGQLGHKFSLGQEVIAISRALMYRADPCRTCKGTKAIDVCGERFRCPKCEGTGNEKTGEYNWYVSCTGRVGQVRITHTAASPGRDEAGSIVVEYMIDATGVGSGTIWSECNLFVDRSAAGEEIAFRNAHPYTWDTERRAP